LLGALLTLDICPQVRGAIARNVTTLLGIVLIIGSYVVFSADTLYPGIANLAPCIGTALIIVQQMFFSIGGDGDKIVLGAVLAAILLLWSKGLVGIWDFLATRTAMRAGSSRS